MYKGKNIDIKELLNKRSITDEKTKCWNWQGYIQSGGYGQFRYKNKMTLAHRASYAAYSNLFSMSSNSKEERIDFVFDFLRGKLICHHCDNTKCVNPNHLFCGSHQDNTDDARSKGRLLIQNTDFEFTKHKRINKLTDKDVLEIRKSDWPLKDLAKKYNVSMSQISMVRRGKRKQLVKGYEPEARKRNIKNWNEQS